MFVYISSLVLFVVACYIDIVQCVCEDIKHCVVIEHHHLVHTYIHMHVHDMPTIFSLRTILLKIKKLIVEHTALL